MDRLLRCSPPLDCLSKKYIYICVFFHSNEMCGHEGQESESYGCPTSGSAKMIIIV